MLTAAVVATILVFLVVESATSFLHVGPIRFLSDESWHPASNAERGTFNLLPMIAATLISTLGAIMIAMPLGIGTAVFVRFYAPRQVGYGFLRVIELLAGIPSVVYGLWGLTVLVPWIGRYEPPGASLLAAVIVLSIMILPTIALLATAALESLPMAYIQASQALGLSLARTVFSVALPAVRPSLVTATILATGRALGETMAVLMVAGNVVQFPSSVFQPVRTITANIALEMAYAMGDHRGALFVCGLALMIVVVALVLLIEWANRGATHA